MANLEITNNESAGVVIWEPVYRNDQLFTAAGAVVYPAGMIVTLAAGKYIPFVAGSDLAHGILPYEIDATAGAGDFPTSILIGGQVRLSKIGSTDALVAPTDADILSLQDFGIIALSTNQLGELDNQ